MSAETDLVVRFGAFELDLRTGELRKAGVRVSLPDQPFQVLKALLERPGDLVTREDLRQRLWPAETFVDFEHGLNAAVRRLRDALGDSAEASRFVATLPRRGYRFIAPVASRSAAALPAPPSPAPEAHPDASRPGVAPALYQYPVPIQDAIWDLARSGFKDSLAGPWQHELRSRPDSLRSEVVRPLTPSDMLWVHRPT